MKKNFLSAGAVLCFLLTALYSYAQTTLPLPEYRFKGNIGTTFKNSDPAVFPKPAKPPEGAPNILLILLDDVGFGQFSVTGGGVPSPQMDRLLDNGVLYNQFHTTALCSPTRAALLTGRNHHSAGTGIITELATGYDGYTGVIPRSTATIGEILRQNGYATAWFGKNHNTPVYETGPLGPFDHWPNGLGFDYFYGFNAGDINQFRYDLVENRNPVERPEGEVHLSTLLANKTIEYLQRAEAFEPDKPWFVYLATAATHSPHQVSQEWIDKFKGKYDMGWDVYREQTFARQKKLGVLPENAQLTARPESLPAWDSLNADQKKLYSRMMEVYAAYGAHVDYEVGRVLDYVHTLPDADNTMIIYIVGDNGASAEGGLEGAMNEIAVFNSHSATYKEILPYMDELGTEKHFNHFPAEWAWAMSTPFKWTKQVASHLGGVRNPMIISWPARLKAQYGIRHQFTHVTDIAPTLLDAAGLEEPLMVNGVAQKPMEGHSFFASITNPDAPESHTMQYFEMFANRAIYKDGWWAGSRSFVPWQPDRSGYDPNTAKWEMYNLKEDFTQANDLAAKYPERLQQLEALWWAQASKYNALPLDWRGAARFSAELTGKPNPGAGRKHYVYPYAISGLPEASAPNLKNKNFSIAADVEVSENDSGMIFTQGGNTAGWGFYMMDGSLYFTHNYIDLERFIIKSDGKISAGKHEVKAVFEYKGAKAYGQNGTVTLFVDGKNVGGGEVKKTTPFLYSMDETQDIGMDGGTGVDNNYEPPFTFSGKLSNIVIDLQ
ncbi:arylsulfatase [Desulforhopalus singaporensis]|uniref:Arylsulfatase n=1 Tax=Desulforhopalus singaporensis TaxID=91360 RepID=A0A1H0V788_9BACT|nr:arylsulfatase [Desulforhopalus singaporensis]SDP74253.1 arylsulfatase [Desulforhopalus singaporensis]